MAEGVAEEYFDGGLHKRVSALNEYSETKSQILSNQATLANSPTKLKTKS